MSSMSASIEPVKTVVIDSDVETKLLQNSSSPYVCLGLIDNSTAYVVAGIRIPSGSMSIKWISTFVKLLTGMLPGGIVPIGVACSQADFTALLEFRIEQHKLKCRRHSRTSKINVAIKPQSGLAKSLHCLRAQISISLPLTSLHPSDIEQILTLFLQKSAPVLKDASSDVLITKTNALPLNKLGGNQHQIDFLLSTLQTQTGPAPIAVLSGTIAGIAYAVPQTNLFAAAEALQADLIRNWVYRWSLFQDFNSDELKPAGNASCQLPKRILFPDPDSKLYLSDYVFPEETLDVVNDRIEEYLGLKDQLQSLDDCVEKFAPNSPTRTPSPDLQKNAAKSSNSKALSPSMLALLALIPILIGIFFMIIMK